MIATNYSEVRNNLKTYCDKATKDYETIIITRKNNENVVLMSEEEYNNLMENLYIRSNLKYYQRLVESIKEVEKGNVKEHDLVEVD
ncbi:type II toxin-antitoxin system prevent-host-death family antitoxin [Fusobacterium vincentii]|uniref:Antitoxin n=1 Tax=Fusobacterium nucleatum TaxID=851 RepID=A0AAX3MC10_FUSNU|nr:MULTISPECIES: type II toxin-antitoxin system prevent-host-death family antitoxin [Fusobacterium]ALF19044.1 prevent-host-death protein [Fusobacterium vincentii ChDC F8]ATV06687.1 type II toxin-antitoxin system prevent-host-death family antitoxin [Fusobacterium vincentii]PIH01561.1 type II toxin-antitoxin system prevent-host-death family antitoxin [Fusobacterium vincentii]WDA44234.1 type II toxin-antitoxin system prevent-host-death family antitoxin [Fusobacterium nucleatum]VTX75258.1 Antitoxi